MVGSLDRQSLIPYKTDSKDYSENSIFFNLPFNFNILNCKKIIFDSFKTISNCDLFSKIKFKFINSIQPNLSSLLVHNFKLEPLNYHFYTKCKNQSCKVCSYASLNYFINIKNFIFPILSNSSCSSVNVIYIISCRLCNSYYVGQTKYLKKRISEHLNTCIFNNSFGGNCKGVMNHFNKNGHNLEKNFCFYVFRTNIEHLYERLDIEAQLINILKILKVKIMNDLIPSIKNFKYLTSIFVS